MKKNALIMTLLLFGALPLHVTADEGTAKGHMVVNGKSIELTHAYALARPDSFDKAKEELRVILSDAAISDDELRHDRDTLDKRAAGGSFHAISIVIGDDMFGHGKSIDGNDIFTAEINNGWISTSGLDTIEVSSMDSAAVAGRAHMKSPHDFDDAHVKFDYDVTFHAKIIR